MPAIQPKRNVVYAHEREVRQPALILPEDLLLDAPNVREGQDFLASLPAAGFPLCIFDPQYRGLLDHTRYGNEGERQKGRSLLRQMTEADIRAFLAAIDRVLMPSGHLLLWTDKFHLCTGVAPWFAGTAFETVDLIVWNKKRFGMGYRTRRVSEYLLIVQKAPRRAKGVWTRHDIPDVWDERLPQGSRSGAGPRPPHAKPIDLQSRLIEALTHEGEIVLDPAAGSYSVLAACRQVNRRFLGCDVESAKHNNI
jgi:site-specific DNA-methyltransferase (adenine-specific)